jgi:type IV pilus assembly protein PilQ
MHSDHKIRNWWVICALVAGLFAAGCAADKAAKKDPFFEKWQTLAQESKGHSPVAAPKEDVLTWNGVELGSQVFEEKKLEEVQVKVLPRNVISLKMRQADIKAVLRALARGVGINMLIRNDIKEEITVDFVNVPWEEAFKSILKTQGLSYLWEGDILRIASSEDIENSIKLSAAAEKEVKQKLASQSTAVVSVHYADPKMLRDNFQELLRNVDGRLRGYVRVDEHSNSLILQAPREDLNRMIPIIAKIDKPSPQILIKCNIVETTRDMARQIGVQWGGTFHTSALGGGRNLIVNPGGSGGSAAVPVPPANPPTTGGYTPIFGSTGVSGQGMGVNFPIKSDQLSSFGGVGSVGFVLGNIGSDVLELQLEALQSDNKIRILSSPTITTLNNQKAFTENGERVPYSTLDTSVVPPTRTVKFEDAVLRLEITPHVIDGTNLKMKILVKKDEVDTSRTVDGNPFIIKKQTDTSLIVHDGETIVISGLTKKTLTDASIGIPGLKDTPLLGWLFGRLEKEDKMEEVLIFITPHILPVRTAAVTVSPPGPEEKPATGETQPAAKQ